MLNGLYDGGGTVTEFLPEGYVLVPGSTTGGGTFHAATGSITWEIPRGASMSGFRYRPSGSDTPPSSVGQWQHIGGAELLGVLGSGTETQQEADDLLKLHELAQRPTFDEARDGRVGSVLLQADSDGNVQLRFGLQTSEDLLDWTTTPETLDDPITVEHPLDAPKRFFRFKLKG